MAVYLGAGLFGIFLVIVAIMVWQEAKKRGYEEGPVYVIEDAVAFVKERLSEDTGSRLKRSDVRRILEYEVHHLQGLAQEKRRNPVEVVAGGTSDTVDWIVVEIDRKHGVSYSREDVSEVLEWEAAYLVSIGAVGDPVGGEE